MPVAGLIQDVAEIKHGYPDRIDRLHYWDTTDHTMWNKYHKLQKQINAGWHKNRGYVLHKLV